VNKYFMIERQEHNSQHKLLLNELSYFDRGARTSAVKLINWTCTMDQKIRPRNSIEPGFPFWLASVQHISNRKLLIPQSGLVFVFCCASPSFGSAKRQFRPARKTRNREVSSFQAFRKTPTRPLSMVCLVFCCVIASLYPVAEPGNP
jgi:hypothetical protein